MDQVNLLPWRQITYLRRVQSWYCRSIGSFILAMLVLLYFSTRSSNPITLPPQESSLESISQEVTRKPSSEISATQQVDATTLIDATLSIIDKLHLIIPRGVYLESIEWRAAELSMTGSALSYQLLTGLIEALERFGDSYTPRLERATMQAGTQAAATVKFSMKLYIRS